MEIVFQTETSTDGGEADLDGLGGHPLLDLRFRSEPGSASSRVPQNSASHRQSSAGSSVTMRLGKISRKPSKFLVIGSL